MNHVQDDRSAGATYRKIIVNGSQTSAYSSNAISTTKYTILTFIPLFLFEQFHNYTNCFFLLISIFQQFPEAASLGRYTTLIPLCIILSISGVKEILEDIQRHRADRRINKKTTEVYKNSEWTQTTWKNVQVGDLLKVRNNQCFPADLLLLQCSCETGISYIETVNLDGENNLKIRHHVPSMSQDKNPSQFTGTVECDPPNEMIYNFNGLYHMEDRKISLTANHILLRGALLRNTSWIIGLVIYTGFDTKIMKNSSHTRMKRSSVSAMVNSQIIVLFVLFLSFTLLHWIFFMIWNNKNYEKHWYLPIERQNITDGSTLVICLVFGILYAIMIPISLQVMQELSRYIQGMFICNDLDMYYEEMDVPALVKTSSLNEDLALVKYIFADKTGTLTKNILEFKCCSIQGTVYNQDNIADLNKVEGGDPNIFHHLFIAVCVCPGVVPVRSGTSISYYASSPDQKALLQAARDFGYVLVGRNYNSADIKINNRIFKYKVLCEFEFSSDRKRTSVIVKTPNDQLMLYVIGADEVIFPRLSDNLNFLEITSKHIDEFSAKGLRSLCVAMAEIKQSDFDSWYPMYKAAQESMSQENLMEKAEKSIVKNLSLLGATAVEDKLQDDVPETIADLLEAGINIWMLTGDKQETATNIGFACRLFNSEMPLITLNTEDMEMLRYAVNHQIEAMGQKFGKPGNNYGLIVTGSCLKILLDSIEDSSNFIQLMLSCRSVICCRTTPKQKALVVKNVKKQTNYVTLAIGDGANDVAMIQTASIGVGISGMEGLQAANAADYSIGQFKYLKKLLLVHGTWSYNRVCKMIYFIYYKNVLIAVMQLYITASSAWSGMLLFDRWARMMYNVILTGAPTLALGIFEQNLPQKTLMDTPYAYTRNTWFNMKTFTYCLLNAFVHSILLTWLSLSIFGSDVLWSAGFTDDYLMVGNMVYTIVIAVVCLKSGLHSLHWTIVTFVFLIGSLASWFVSLAVLSYTWPYIPVGEDMPRAFNIILTTPLFWLYLVFSIVAILGLDFVAVIMYRIFREPIVNLLKNTALRNGNRLGISI